MRRAGPRTEPWKTPPFDAEEATAGIVKTGLSSSAEKEGAGSDEKAKRKA